MEDGEWPWGVFVSSRVEEEGSEEAVPFTRRVGVVVKERVWEMRRRRQGRQ